MKLYYTPKSHFARKVRLLIDALELPIELVDAGNVSVCAPEVFANNPLMKVPTLEDGGMTIYESDLIAQYVVKNYASKDAFEVLTEEWTQLNARAVMNGVMSAEVELIMADRTGIDINAYSRFDKYRDTVLLGLEWLEKHAGLFDNEPKYADFHLVSLWDHLVLYDMFTLNYPQLEARVKQLADLPYLSNSSPL